MILGILTDVASMRCPSDRLVPAVRVIVTQDYDEFNASIPEPIVKGQNKLSNLCLICHTYTVALVLTYIHMQAHVTQIHMHTNKNG